MKTTRQLFLILLAAAVFAASVWHSPAVTLGVPYYAQRTFLDARSNNVSQWCWAASSQMILAWYAVFRTQEDIAAYGSGGSNHWNYMTGTWPAAGTVPALKGIDVILRHFGAVNTTFFTRKLTKAELTQQIDAQRPAVARIGWTAGGGHFVVLQGFDGDVIDINDPWPSNGQLMRTYDSFSAGGAGVYTPSSGGHQWTHTLTTGAAIDLAFLIDSTGSMWDDIDAVKSSAVNIITNVFTRFADARVAVVDYKDYPDGDHGYFDDYITQTQTVFTTNQIEALNAINGLDADGGADWPEAVYSALWNTLDGAILGGWRSNPVQRVIIMMGDAPGHDPEPWTGGHSLSDVLAKATASGFEIAVNTLVIGGDTNAAVTFQSIAGGTGGAAFEADDAGDVVAAITAIVEETSTSERYPRGAVAAIRPKFSFKLTGDSMGAAPDYYVLELSRSNTVSGKWTTFQRAKLAPGNSYVPKNPLPVGTYRWRLGIHRKASAITAPGSGALGKAAGGLIYENQYIEFTRESVTPGSADPASPSTFFSATDKTMTYTFNTGINASSYALRIFRGERLWKTLTVKPPASNPLAPTLSVRVPGHVVDEDYYWTVTSLNYDFPKP